MVDLGQRFRNFNPDNLKTYTVPVDDTVARRRRRCSSSAPTRPSRSSTIFRGEPVQQTDDSTEALLPTQVRVQVLNGTRTTARPGR